MARSCVHVGIESCNAQAFFSFKVCLDFNRRSGGSRRQWHNRIMPQLPHLSSPKTRHSRAVPRLLGGGRGDGGRGGVGSGGAAGRAQARRAGRQAEKRASRAWRAGHKYEAGAADGRGRGGGGRLIYYDTGSDDLWPHSTQRRRAQPGPFPAQENSPRKHAAGFGTR